MRSATKAANSWWHFGGVPVYDWLLIIAGVAASLYVGFSWYGFDSVFLGMFYQCQNKCFEWDASSH